MLRFRLEFQPPLPCKSKSLLHHVTIIVHGGNIGRHLGFLFRIPCPSCILPNIHLGLPMTRLRGGLAPPCKKFRKIYFTFHMWKELTFLWNELTIFGNDLTIRPWNEMTGYRHAPSRLPMNKLKSLLQKTRKVTLFVWKSIRKNTPLSSEIHCYVKNRKGLHLNRYRSNCNSVRFLLKGQLQN